MKELEIQPSCEIDNLITVVAERTGQTYDETESQAFKEGIYPTGNKSYVDIRWPNENDGWFKKEIQKILKEKSLQGIYITQSI